jgi:tetratricopeptide (TPR) repeat protein/uncharacterized protein Smg (DUF494 family)
MAKISLHAYNREIENLIERGQTEEAIAHCKYILKQFPKHINTYRLLGKTYLESQRYSEAADILQRVLSSIPDDFVSQLGMSIIREDEGNLDAAIWHMERAYEVQPANTAIQDELRRLYGRRDGVEPPKVRLTRGALVRMYARGELYTQAISEARAALAEDPQRVDLEIILARMYYLAGMKVEATEVCSRLASKLPFCYEANRILAEILPSTSRADDAKIFQQNLNSLDPYAAFVSSSAQTSDQVPENAVQVQRLDWSPTAEDQQPPEWTRTVGVEYQQEASDLPDWLESLPSSSLASAPQREETTSPFEEELDFSADVEKSEPAEIPEWMREAGWTQANEEEQEEPASVFDLAGEDEEEIAEAELPAWLKDMAPPEEDTAVTPEEQARLELLDSILPPETTAETVVSEEPEQPEPAAIEEEQTLQPGAVEEEATPVDDAAPPFISEIDIVQDTTIYKTGRTGALPKWLEEELESDVVGAEQLPEEELPEWLRPVEEEAEPETPVDQGSEQETAGSEDEDIQAGIAWLESLAENQGAEADTLLTTPEERLETPPEWVTRELETPTETLVPGPFDEVPDAAAAAEDLQAPVEGAVPASEQPEVVEEVPSETETTLAAESEVPGEITGPELEAPMPPAAETGETEEIDAALAWLETLAERQGADEETLSTRPEERLEGPPEWVKEEMQTTGATLQPEPTAEVPLPEEQPAETALPDANAVLEEIAPVDHEEASDPEQAVEAQAEGMDEEDAFTWLESLAARQGAEEETLLTAPEDRVETPPEWVYEETGEPAAASESEAETEEIEPAEEQPGWIEQMSQEEPVEAEPPSETAPTDWFTSLPVETPAPAAEDEAELEETPVAPPEAFEETRPDWFAELEPETGEPTAEIAFEEAEQQLAQADIDQPQAEFVEVVEETIVTDALPDEDDTRPVRVYPFPVREEAEETEIMDTLEGTPAETPVEEVLVAPETVEPDESAEIAQEFSTEEPLEQAFSEPEIHEPVETAEMPEEPAAEPLPDEALLEVDSFEVAELAEIGELAVEEPVEEAALEPAETEEITVEPETFEAGEPVEFEEIAVEEPLEEATVDPEALEAEPETVQPEPLVEQLMSDDLPQTAREQAFTLLDSGQIEAAVERYNQIIESGELLDTVIEDLRKSLDRYPVDISIWQALGDAYLRNDQVQEALDSYTKAEELLR